jgi:hypothetical protein
MPATYTLHVAPHAAAGAPDALERATLVRDGFSWGAFLVPALWYFWHRHWVAGIAALVLVTLFTIVLAACGVRPGAIVLAQALLHLLHGFEGASIRRWLYARRDRPVVDVVRAHSVEEAEMRAFERWMQPIQMAPRRLDPVPGFAPFGSARLGEPVIGLFPDAEGRA